MKNKFLRYWNLKPLGLILALSIIIRLCAMSLYEKCFSLLWSLNLGSAGKRIKIQRGVVIRLPKNVSFSNRVSIGRNCQISTEFLDSNLVIKDDTHVDKNCTLDFSGGLIIDENVTISEGVMIETHSHGIDPRSKPTKKPLQIERNVWIGARAIILPGVELIEEGAVIGAGSIVTKKVTKGQIVVGNPGRSIRVRT